MSNFILKPIINWLLATILGKDSLSEVFTFLQRVDKLDDNGAYVLDELGARVPDLEESIYIDWGAFINAVINFLIVAFVLFIIVKTINNIKDGKMLKEGKIAKADRKAMRKAGIKLSDKAAVKAYFDAKAEKEAADKAAAEEKARLDRLANPTTEDLLKDIRELLKNK
jgi:large-conductance mechanosensitive channel